MLVTAVMLRIIWVANSMDVIYVMTGGGPGYATHTLPLYAFKRTYSSMDFGYGSALERFTSDVIEQVIEVRDGHAFLPAGIGLGVSLDKEAVARHALGSFDSFVDKP